MTQISNKHSAKPIDLWHSASGPLTIPLTNDYLFRALLQLNNNVLKALISALLGLPLSAIQSAVINNPIILGEAINEKTFFLDIVITLNDSTLVNLEMQVINEHNWPERSLSYLCRTFDNLNSGDSYLSVKPAFQIGLLDFTLFPEYPEFYSTYQFMNAKNHTIYSDKLYLSVLNLTRIDLATEEDKARGLDHWAALFKATTWEELKMLAKQNPFIDEASATIYQLSQEEKIRWQCAAREDYYKRQRTIQELMDQQGTAILEQNEVIKGQYETIKSQDETIKNQDETIKNQDETINELAAKNLALQKEMENLKQQLAAARRT